MSFEVITAESFDRALKPLVKRYPSLKQEIAGLGERLSSEPEQEFRLAKIAIKSAFPSEVKEKVNRVERELSRASWPLKKRSFC